MHIQVGYTYTQLFSLQGFCLFGDAYAIILTHVTRTSQPVKDLPRNV